MLCLTTIIRKLLMEAVKNCTNKHAWHKYLCSHLGITTNVRLSRLCKQQRWIPLNSLWSYIVCVKVKS